MIYIYNCYGGTHSSALAAAYHLKKLDPTREPTKEEILNTHNFNTLTRKDFGKLYFKGIDEDGNKVYTIGRGRSKYLVPGLYSMSQRLQEEHILNDQVVFTNTSPTVPLPMTFGGLTSRWMKIDFIGVPLLVIGAKKSYKDIVALVDFAKETGRASDKSVQILPTESYLHNLKKQSKN
jgi:hypothetical protein